MRFQKKSRTLSSDNLSGTLVPTGDETVTQFINLQTPTQPSDEVVEAQPAQPADVVEVPAPVLIDYPKDLYDDAHNMNDRIDFELALQESMVVKENTYVPPPPAPEIAKRTLEEMEAGRKRVAEMAAIEVERRKIAADRKPEAWEGQTKEVFRPGTYIPNPKAPNKVTAQTLASQ